MEAVTGKCLHIAMRFFLVCGFAWRKACKRGGFRHSSGSVSAALHGQLPSTKLSAQQPCRSRRSPSWVAPIAQFVDEQCIIFEDQVPNCSTGPGEYMNRVCWSLTTPEQTQNTRFLASPGWVHHLFDLVRLSLPSWQEENKLEYTECHNEFRQLIGSVCLDRILGVMAGATLQCL